jgi:hypothetical protein
MAGVSPEAKALSQGQPLLLSHYVKDGRKCNRLKHHHVCPLGSSGFLNQKLDVEGADFVCWSRR